MLYPTGRPGPQTLRPRAHLWIGYPGTDADEDQSYARLSLIGWPEPRDEKTAMPNDIDKPKEDVPVFLPPVPPTYAKKSYFHTIEDGDIQTEEDLQKLLRLMYDCPEHKFYLFAPKDKPASDVILGAERAGLLKFDIIEFHYYPHPNFKSDYVKIQERTIEFDWERDVLKTAPMHTRTTISLSEKGRRQFELQEIRKEVEDATARKQPKTLLGRFKMFIGDHASACFWAIVSAIISTLFAYWFLM